MEEGLDLSKTGTDMKRQTRRLSEYKKTFENELRKNILSYWIKYSVEKKRDGFYGAVDLNGTPVLTAKKSCVLNARILWTFSAAAALYHDPQYAGMADRAFETVQKYFADCLYGGYYMELNPDNSVASGIKHTYAQAFVIYSLCQYYAFNPAGKTLEILQDFFTLFETKTKDPDHAGYREAFTTDWKIIEENRMADNNEPKSMNTHLHVMEAYSALYKVWKDKRVKIRLTEMLNLFLDKIIRNDGHLGIFFDKKFDETENSKGICSFGHDIEASWLLFEAAEILGDQKILEDMRKLSVKMVDAVERTGLDRDGGLFLESTRFGSHLRTNKHWWLQAETLVGFMNAFQLTDDIKYWNVVELSWDFINRHVIDHQRGEWYTKVNRAGVPFLTEPPDDPSPYYRNDWKIDPWKCPYHNGRAMMELMHRIDKILNN
jgi:cellobiose epimerase